MGVLTEIDSYYGGELVVSTESILKKPKTETNKRTSKLNASYYGTGTIVTKRVVLW